MSNEEMEDKINAALDGLLKEEESTETEGEFSEEDIDDELDEIEFDEENISEDDEIIEDDTEEEDTSEEEDILEEQPAQDEDEGYDEEEEEPVPVKKRSKSARPSLNVYVPTDDFDEQELHIPQKPKKKKKHKGLKITGLLLLMVLAAGGCAYGAGSYYYSNRFFEGTWINGLDCSGKTAYEVENLLADHMDAYSIQVSSREQEPQTITGDQIDYHYVSSGEVLSLMKAQKPYLWVKGFYEQHSYSVAENVTYDKTLLQQQIKTLNCAQNENQTEPEDAYVAFNGTEFVIIPETEGSKLDIKQAYKALEEAVSANETAIDFNAYPDTYEAAAVTQDSAELQSTLEVCNNYTQASITYTFGDAYTETLDGSTIKDWLQFDEKGRLVWDDNSFQQHITDYVANLAAAYNTVGTEREFNTTSGRTVYVTGANYGWQIDQAAEAAQLTQEIESGTQTTREPNYSQTANAYGVNDLGSTYIEVDLSEQHMYYYQNGSIIFESDFVSGNMAYEDRQTHAGIFTLYYKKSPDVLRGTMKADGSYEYESKVQYWMPFDGGIGFHDASWRDEFGGDIYLTSGSHGCINMPTENAATLYSIIDYNVPIICFY